MKLRNKKTEEIREIKEILIDGMFNVNSLAELNDEWEDYEEPKEKHWYMTSWGEVWQYGDDPLHEEWRILLGNDFETKEEAKKAVEKLKAWKRLKDNGVSFEVKTIDGKWYLEPKSKQKERTFNEVHDISNDLMLLFGVEE